MITAMLDLEWGYEALCAQTEPEIFHPPKGASPEPAKRICRRCPVLRQCLRWAVETRQPDGVLGGTSPKERQALTVADVDAMPPVVVADQRIPQGRPLPLTVVPKVRPLPIPEPRPVPEVVEQQQPAKPGRQPAVCGTVSGYGKHKRLKEPYCDACKAAKAEYQREYVARKKPAARVPGSTPRPTPPAPRPPTIDKPVVRVMWLLPPNPTVTRTEYAIEDEAGALVPVHSHAAVELAAAGERIHCRHVTDWAPVGGAS